MVSQHKENSQPFVIRLVNESDANFDIFLWMEKKNRMKVSSIWQIMVKSGPETRYVQLSGHKTNLS